MTPGERLRDIMVRGLNSDELAEPNTFATTAVIAAFNEGEEWLDALNAYIAENKRYAVEYMNKNLPELKVTDSEATYLLWIDCSGLTNDVDAWCDKLRKEQGLYLSTGSQYRGNGASFVRMNLACPKSQVDEGLRRLTRGVEEMQNK